MKIIISPAKKMREDPDTVPAAGTPFFLDRAKELAEWIKGLSFSQQKELWACSEKLAAQNRERFLDMDPERNPTPALLAYEGIQYQYMAPGVFEREHWEYAQSHLRILSAFYGVLRPLDGVVPYRLEMQAKGAPPGWKDLYDFWGSGLCDRLLEEEWEAGEEPLIVNLASKEYSRCVESRLRGRARMITAVFGEYSGGKIVQKGTMAKMARGEMARFLAERQIRDPEEMKAFDRLGYRFVPEASDEGIYTFIREKFSE